MPMRQTTQGTSKAVIFCSTAILVFGSSFEPAQPIKDELRVMTFNIPYHEPGFKIGSWAARKEMVAGTVRFLKADLAGFQEVVKEQITDLEALLPEYAWLGVGRDDGKAAGEFNPLFYLKKRFRILKGATFWLSETPSLPGKKGWDAAYPRIVTWARLEDLSRGETFHIFNTHFDNMGETARMESARLLLRMIREIAGGGPVIVTGDFNFNEKDSNYRILTSETAERPGLADTRRLSVAPPYGSNHTFNVFSQNVAAGARIDFIFVRNTGPVLRYSVISDKWDGRFVSDHNAVAADILVRK